MKPISALYQLRSYVKWCDLAFKSTDSTYTLLLGRSDE